MKTFYLLAILLDGFEVTEQVNLGAYDSATCEQVREVKMQDQTSPYGYICYDKPVWNNAEHINPNQ